MGVQNLSKSVKICQSYWQKFAATFFMSHSVFGKGVCVSVCLSVCPQGSLKAIADYLLSAW